MVLKHEQGARSFECTAFSNGYFCAILEVSVKTYPAMDAWKRCSSLETARAVNLSKGNFDKW